MSTKTAVKERPILFKGEMVRAILEGRKTQTRRICNQIPHWDHYGKDIMDWDLSRIRHEGDRILCDVQTHVDDYATHELHCPYGKPGDRLWVRETLKRDSDGVWRYAADGAVVQLQPDDPRVSEMLVWAHHKEGDTCVSIHMPRFASRLILQVEASRVERLRQITEEDAKAEGCWGTDMPSVATTLPLYSAVFRSAWNKMHGAESWESNPWVWVITFRPVSP